MSPARKRTSPGTADTSKPTGGERTAAPTPISRRRARLPLNEQDRRTTDLLERKIRERGRTLQDVSVALGMPKTGLSRRFSGWKQFTVTELYEVLGEIGLSAKAFFDELHTPRPTVREALGDIFPLEPVSAEDMHAALAKMKQELLAIFEERARQARKPEPAISRLQREARAAAESAKPKPKPKGTAKPSAKPTKKS